MAIVRFRLEIQGNLDTLDYPIPADGKLLFQLREEIQEAVETNLPIEINEIKIKRVAAHHDDYEVRD